MESVLTKKQVKTFGPVKFSEAGKNYQITAQVRYDDECGNGYNSFAITGTIHLCDVNHKPVRWDSGGCLHAEIAKYFPELAPYIKWHLCASDGPMHYIANTVYLAGDRDYNGLKKGEVRQILNGKTGKPSWILESDKELPKYIDSDDRPTMAATLRYVAWNRIGEGKARELDAARNTAIWPDATDEELTQEPEALKAMLLARLPQLLAEFRAAMELLGFVF